MAEGPDPLVVMFADISGSTRLYDAWGDERALGWVAECLARLREITAGAGGHTVRTTGDGVLCTFPVADAAIGAGASMIDLVGSMPGPPNVVVDLHIGCHHGVSFESEGDIYGDCVNVAARVAALARPGQFLISEETVEQLSPEFRERVRCLGPMPVKGKSVPPLIYEYVAADSAEATVLRTRFEPHTPDRLVLRHGEREWHLGPGGGPTRYTLGRDASCDIAVADLRASRQHAVIELRGDRYVLADHSSNGTHVLAASGEALVLRHQEIALHGRGRITLGQAPDPHDDRFAIEFAIGRG